jgi:hypothetical protein
MSSLVSSLGAPERTTVAALVVLVCREGSGVTRRSADVSLVRRRGLQSPLTRLDVIYGQKRRSLLLAAATTKQPVWGRGVTQRHITSGSREIGDVCAHYDVPSSVSKCRVLVR